MRIHIFIIVLVLVGCGGTQTATELTSTPIPIVSPTESSPTVSPVESLPTKGYSIYYMAVDESLEELGTAPLICSELDGVSLEDRAQMIRKTHPDIETEGRTEADWIELELAYLAVCFSQDSWSYGTVSNLNMDALIAMLSADLDTPSYCEALEGLPDDKAQALLLETHSGPLYVSLKDVEADRITMQIAYIAACQDLELWGQ